MIKEIVVNVSKKIGQPEFSSVMLSASITTSVEEADTSQAFTEAWAMAWEEVNKQEEEFKTRTQIEDVVKTEAETPPEPDPIMDRTAPYCPIHRVALTWRPAGVSKRTGKAYAGFYACPEKNQDGSFCTYKPK